MFPYSGDDLFYALGSNDVGKFVSANDDAVGEPHSLTKGIDQEEKIRILTELKAHIKRELVELSEVPRYFDSLKLANKSNDFRISSIAFSTVCHLIKRVGMQDPLKLKDVAKASLPILINQLLDPKPNFRAQAKKSLETFWLANPSTVENYLRDIALIHSNHNIRSESIVFISDLIELNENFDFYQFLPNLVNLLRDDSVDVVKNTEVLLVKYFIFNKTKVSLLVKEFKSQKIELRTAVRILKEVDNTVANAYSSESRAQTLRPTIDSFNNLTRSRPSKMAEDLSKIRERKFTVSNELAALLDKVPTSKLDESIPPLVLGSPHELNREVENLLKPFTGKETEFNWGTREKNIIKFRRIIIGNSETYPDALLSATRLLLEGISKSVASLRTTLSSNGCQVVKELAAYLNKSIDPVAEHLFHPLSSVTSATKKIASMNAFGSLCVLLTNTSFNNRLFNQCFALYQDKSIQPRLYSSTFLQIFILKHGTKLDEQNFDTIKKWLIKGVSDPNITVRESMRTAFWTLHRRFPTVSEFIYSKQDVSVKKALDRSKPSDVTFSLSSQPSRTTNIANDRKKPSIREFVAAKQRERRSTSDSTSLSSKFKESSLVSEEPVSSVAEIGRAARIGGPQRIRVTSAGSNNPLPRQLSKGRTSSLNALNNETSLVNTSTAAVDDYNQLESMKKLLKSPLTRERIQGIHQLNEKLDSGADVGNISSILVNLIILDSILLKPSLKVERFYDLLDISNLLKLIAVNKESTSILLERFDHVEVVKGINTVIRSLESLKFDNAPSTMFHIKYKNTILDFSILNIYNILANDSFDRTSEVLGDVCRSIFPLSISDYPRYDELVVLLYEHDQSEFENILNESSAYVKSKIHTIIKDFKVIIDDKPEATEYGIAEMTMINPLNRKPTDSTTSINPNFGSDMTMILPNSFKSFEHELPQNNDNNDQEMKDPDHKETDYMSDIFNKNDSTREHTIEPQAVKLDSTHEIEVEANEPVQEQLEEINREEINKEEINREEINKEEINKEEIYDEDKHDEDGDFDIKSEPNQVGSPFLDDPGADDTIHRVNALRNSEPPVENVDENAPPGIYSDEMTKNITSQISGIHISPQKGRSLANDNTIDQFVSLTDPLFKKPLTKIKIFEDKPLKKRPEQKITDLEISRFVSQGEFNGNKKQQVKNGSIETITALIEKFEKDEVYSQDMDQLIKSLHRCIDDESALTYLRSSGYKALVSNVINYFNSSANITKALCFKGLVILKETIVLDSILVDLLTLSDTISIWNVLVMIVENLSDFKNEIYVASDELVDELLELPISNCNSTIRESCYLLLKEETSGSTPLVSFLLNTVLKSIDHETLQFEQIKEIGDVVFKHLSSDEVELRRLSIITFSKCKNKLQKIDQNSTQQNIMLTDDESSKDSSNLLFGKLSVSQRKLVDYYSNL